MRAWTSGFHRLPCDSADVVQAVHATVAVWPDLLEAASRTVNAAHCDLLYHALARIASA